MDFDMPLTARLFFGENRDLFCGEVLISDVCALFYSVYFLFNFNTEFHHFIIQAVEGFVARIA